MLSSQNMPKQINSQTQRNLEPSAWQVEKVMGAAMAALDQMREEDGLILDTDEEVLDALQQESIDVRALVRLAVHAAQAADDMADGAKRRREEINDRLKRFTNRENQWRNTIIAMMTALIPPDNEHKRKLTDAEFSLSLRDGKSRAVVSDINDLPEECVEIERVEVKKPRMDIIDARLRAGVETKGAYLTEPEPVLTIRVK